MMKLLHHRNLVNLIEVLDRAELVDENNQVYFLTYTGHMFNV
jgi:hypothetical protein